MKRPSRLVPLMIALGLGALATFGWPLFAWTQGPQVTLDAEVLERLVDVHRGAAPPESLDALKEVKALVRFEAIPSKGAQEAQGSFVVLRSSRVTLARPLVTAFDIRSEYQETIKGLGVRVRAKEDAIQVLIDASAWPRVTGARGPLE